MWFTVLIKIFYAYILWRWILPLFKTRKPIFVFLMMTVLLSASLIAEVVSSWQFQIFTVDHMIHHPSMMIWLNLVIYLVVTLIGVGVYFTRESFRTERQKRELMETQLTTELSFLQAQINPHFLFNTLNNLFSIAQRDKNEELAGSISMLSGLMRYTLYDSKASRVTLQEEIRNMKDFIGLGRMRLLEDEIDVKLTIAGDIEKATIAPMMLLPFVENAFKHGIRLEEKSAIDISINAETNRIKFRCFNLKNGVVKSMESGGIGLENVRRRLALLYPAQHELEIIDLERSFEVRLTLQS